MNQKTKQKNQTSRRTFLKSSALGLAMWNLSGCKTQPFAKTAERNANSKMPNILYIMTDQQSADMISCAGNNDLHTPAIDSIAQNGMLFENAYCSQPLCVPSRVTMFTGKMPHQTGVTYNVDELPTNGPFIGKIMQNQGYDCGYVGKWHVTIDPHNTNEHGFTSCHTTCPKNQIVNIGFNTDQSKYSGIGDVDIPLSCDQFLKRDRQKPFFLVTSFVNPHDICQWARGDNHPNGNIPPAPAPAKCPDLPGNFEIPENEPSIIRKHKSQSPKMYPTTDWSKDKWQQYRWAYCRLVEMVDKQIGQVLDSLKQSGQYENTIIIFTSDHGDGNAAHQWNQKNVLYEETAKIPFIVSWPGKIKPGSVNADLVSNGMDLIPTLCDVAQADVPKEMYGKSLLPLFEGRNTPWREYVVCETDLHHKYGQPDDNFGRMIRTKNFKYIVYNKGENREQLFDMNIDPGEMNNLVYDPAYSEILKKHRTLLKEWAQKTNDPFLEKV